MRFEKPHRFVDRVFLHCSASDQDLKGRKLVDEVERWHKKRGFRLCGYHYLIDKEGRVMYGRRLESKPAAQKGHNDRTIAICCHGLFFNTKWYNSAQALALHDLCDQINDAYEGTIAFLPHNHVSPKSCPVFSVKRLLETDRWNRMK